LFEKIFSLFAENTGLIKTGFSGNDRHYFAAYAGKSGQRIPKNGLRKFLFRKKSSVSGKNFG
jgi:hypothetical protein